MARDYEDIFGTENLDDGELRRLVRETLRENRSIDESKARVMKKQFYLAKEQKFCPACGTPLPDGQTHCPNPTCPTNQPPPVH